MYTRVESFPMDYLLPMRKYVKEVEKQKTRLTNDARKVISHVILRIAKIPRQTLFTRRVSSLADTVSGRDPIGGSCPVQRRPCRAFLCSFLSAMALKINLTPLRHQLGFAGRAGLWKFLALLFALLNLKNLPFAWHVSD